MKKFKYLVAHGLRKRIKSKAFLISSIVIGIILIGLTILPSIIQGFEMDKDKIKGKVLIINESTYDSVNGGDIISSFKDEVYYTLVANPNYIVDINMEIILSNDDNIPLDETYYELDREEDALIYFSLKVIDENGNLNDDNNYLIEMKIFNRSLSTPLLEQILISSRELQRAKYKVDNPSANLDTTKDLYPVFVFDPNVSVEDDFNLMEVLAPILIVPIFVLITFSIQAIGADIIEEKSTKAIEIIIASVPPKTHFLSKLVSINLFVVIQLVTYLIFGLIGISINNIIAGATGSAANWTQILNQVDLNVIGLVVIAFLAIVLGTLLYSVIGAFFASLAINQEDYQQVQTPIMLILMVGYFVSIFAGAFQSSALLKAFIYIPIFSPFTMPVLYASSIINLVDVIVGLSISVATILLLIYLIAPLYKVSILSYDTSPVFKRIKNIIRSSKPGKKKKDINND